MNHRRKVIVAVSAIFLALSMIMLWGGLTALAVADTSGSTKITLLAQEVKKGQDTSILVSARLFDANKPVGAVPVEFDVAADFFGSQQVNLGTVMTDATGTASLAYEPRWQGVHIITAHFRGDSTYPHVEVTRQINFSGPIPAYKTETVGLETVRQWITPVVVAGIIFFWVLLIFVIIHVLRGISRERNNVPTIAEKGTLGRKSPGSISESRPIEVK